MVILAHSDHDSRHLSVRADQRTRNDVCQRFTPELSRFGTDGPKRIGNLDALDFEHEDYCDNGDFESDFVAPLLRLFQRTAPSSIQRARTAWQLGGSK